MSTWDNSTRRINELNEKWESNQPIFISTSGSTGKPKLFKFEKKLMRWSAEQTLKHCIKSNSLKQLIAIPIDRAGGLMQWARAKTWCSNFDLIEPSSNPLISYTGDAEITSLTPMQLSIILESSQSVRVLKQFQTILVGGAELTKDIEDRALNISPNTQWINTFGMTETYSHFAFRKFGDEYFQLIDETEIKSTVNGLMIKNPCTQNNWIDTRDIVKLKTNSTFKWVGRIDFTINSGGIKIQLETIEKLIHSNLNWPLNSFFCWWKNDKKLGQKLIVCTLDQNTISTNWSFLPKYKAPKEIIILSQLVFSSTGKILREQSFQAFSEK